MPEVPLSYLSTQSLRDSLLSRNLQPYAVQGNFNPNVQNQTPEYVQSNSSVVDSPSITTNIDSPMYQSRVLGALNEYGPINIQDGAELISTLQTYNVTQTTDDQGNPISVIGNFNEYDLSDEKLPLITSDFYRLSVGVNKFKSTGDGLLYFVTTVILPSLGQPYYTNIVGGVSSYSLYSILTEDNPTGSIGPMSNDTVLVKIGAQKLKDYFTERINREISDSLNPINQDALNNPFALLTGVEPLIDRDYRITVGPLRIVSTLERISGTYFPASIIPGNYLTNPDSQQAFFGQIVNAFNQTGLGKLASKLFRTNQDTPSELFLESTGGAQKSFLFKNLDYNIYKPYYKRPILGRILDAINPFDNESSVGYYYIGSKDVNVSTLTSPSGELPEDAQGNELSAIVYGQDIVSETFEGKRISSINFGLKGKATYDSTANVDGGFLWSSTKTLESAGKRAGLSGGTRSEDPEYRIIENVIQGHASQNLLVSTNSDFVRDNSLLVKTQQLIDSADKVEGERKLKHAGNAINQISKVFHDGYKIMTKGSQVMTYTDSNINPIGIEYCRVFTKDTPYYTFNDLQKTTARIDGSEIDGNIRKSTYSVLDSTFNLNIAPWRGDSSTNIFNPGRDDAYVKKYMFSIENLAWAGSKRKGFTYNDLPVCERGPNGGRVMWFPPYGLTFTDSSTANFHSNSFLGRPEPIYTYKDTSRSGTLTWKIIVDHPSITNLLVDKVYKSLDDKVLNKVMDSFFSGCKKYDLYELASSYNFFPVDFFFEVQTVLEGGGVEVHEIERIVQEQIPTVVPNPTPPPGPAFDSSKYEGKYGFYYENDYPDPNTTQTTTTTNYQNLYDTYIQQKDLYLGYANQDKKEGVEKMFSVIEWNWTKVKEMMTELYQDMTDGKITQCKIYLDGTTSASASVSYNKKLAERRVSNIKNMFSTYSFDGTNTFAQLINDNKLLFETVALGEVATVNVVGPDFNSTFVCNDVTLQQPPTDSWYSANAMGCRRVGIREIKVTPAENEPQPDNGEQIILVPTEVPVTDRVEIQIPQTSRTTQKPYDKIAKKFIRFLLSECDYFDMIKGSDPIFYDSFSQKIKHFHPAFHSMTPEGLNSRLTFLNQCVRPGDTIPTYDSDSKGFVQNDAINTSFGTPPVLVLRIGDFYNTKIIPNSLSFTYENLDINPEGIGVQPMIANVTLNFNIIGGMGLKEPVDRLQNALSFNFYANTEMYDDRAEETENTDALDESIIAAIFEKKPINPILNNGLPQTNGGTTIGEIQSKFYTNSGITGTTNYKQIMNTLLDQTIGYYEIVYNSVNKMITDYGFGAFQAVTKYNNCYTGEIRRFSTPQTVIIAGKYVDYQQIFDNLATNLIDNIDTNYMVVSMENAGFKNSDIRKFKNNLKSFITESKNNTLQGLNSIINDLTSFQENYVQTFRKLNYVDLLNDGYLLSDNKTVVYDIDGSSTDFINLRLNYDQVGTDLTDYLNQYKNTYGFLNNDYDTSTFEISPDYFLDTDLQFQKMGTIFWSTYKSSSNVEDIIDKLTIGINDVTNPQNLYNFVKDEFFYVMEQYGIGQEEVLSALDGLGILYSEDYDKDSYTPYNKDVDVIVDFTETLSPTTQQSTELQNIYKTVNLTEELLTFNDKIKFI